MTIIKVVIGGATVWSEDVDYESWMQFPAEYRQRPAEDSGIVHELWVGDELIGLQRSHADEADQYEAAVATAQNEDERKQLAALAAEARAHSALRIAKEGN